MAGLTFICEGIPVAVNDNGPECPQCGARFAYRAGKIFCTRVCKKRASATRNGKQTTAPERQCENCGLSFKRRPNTKDAARFCSRVCAGTGPLPDGGTGGNVIKLVVSQRECAQCGEMFRPANNDRGARFCGSLCAENNAHVVANGVRRARMCGAANDNVNPIAVFERDGWQCRMCGVETPRYLRGTDHPHAPELDHVVALAVGGSHTYDNTQCSCLRCNRAKGTKSLKEFMIAA